MIRWAHRFLVCARAGTNGGSAVQLLASLFRRALCGWQLTSPPKPLMLLHNLPHTGKPGVIASLDPRLMAGDPSGILPTSTTACFFNSLLVNQSDDTACYGRSRTR